MPDTPQHPHRSGRPDHPAVPAEGTGHDAALRPDAPPLEASGDPPHPRAPEEYLEEPGSHRRGPDGAATDVGG